MSDTKLISAFVVILAGIALWLHSKGKLYPVLDAMTGPAPNASYRGPTLGELAIALIIYLFTLSLLSPRSGLWLTAILVMGALIYNAQSNPGDSVIEQLFGRVNTGQLSQLTPSEQGPTQTT